MQKRRLTRVGAAALPVELGRTVKVEHPGASLQNGTCNTHKSFSPTPQVGVATAESPSRRAEIHTERSCPAAGLKVVRRRARDGERDIGIDREKEREREHPYLQ